MHGDLTLKHEFVDFIPEELERGTIYVAMDFGTVVHNCCCGCGNRVITPLSPTDWKLTYDGETISLDPSIGNWNFKCQSHYWIKQNQVSWSWQWSRKEIEAGRKKDALAKENHFAGIKAMEVTIPTIQETEPEVTVNISQKIRRTFWDWIFRR